MLQNLKWAHTLAHTQMHRYLHTKTALVMSCNKTYAESGSNDFRYADSYVIILYVLLLRETEEMPKLQSKMENIVSHEMGSNE
jgi:hypothetical protein